MDLLIQTQAVPTWAIIFVGLVAALSLFALILLWIKSSSNTDRPTMGTSVEKEEEEKQEEGFTVLAKFRDGSEARWRKIESWDWGGSDGQVALYRDGEIIAILPYQNLVWAVDEKFEFERIEPKAQLNG